MRIPILTDGAVVLDALTDTDLDDVTAACQDPDVAVWTTVPSPYERTDAEAFLDGYVRPGWVRGDELVWAVRAAGEHRLMGAIGLHRVRDQAGEIGYWMAPWARRRGLGVRAARLLVDHALDPAGLDLVRVRWSAFVGNWPSRRVAWQAGVRFEGTRRQDVFVNGVRHDQWVGGILRGDSREPVEPWPAAEAGDGRAVRPA
jgi:RimJ/RimL family protein N-acetyltransferase